jgi:predicted dehydrogenase
MVNRHWQDLSVLIVGCGSIGRRHARVLSSLGVRHLRACDPLAAQRAALLAESPSVQMDASFEEGLKTQPDTVLICTPPQLHVPMAMQAIQAGCHVLSEKPLSDSLDGVEALESLANAAGKKVMVGLCFRYHVGTLKAKHYLDSGRVGRLVSVRALMGEYLPEVRPDYRSLFSAQVGGAFDLMHDIDLAIWYAARPVTNVIALHGAYSDIGIRAPDLVELLMDFGGVCLGSVHLDFFQRPRRRQIELLCSEGVIIVEFARWDRCVVSVYEATSRIWTHEELPTDRDDMFRSEDREFLEAVAQNRPIQATIAEARKSLEVVVAAQAARQPT